MSPPSAQASRVTYPMLQVLRGFAALLVVMHHAQLDAVTIAGRTGQRFVPVEWLPWGAGVDVFFVISGFIIVHAARRLFATPRARRVFLAHRIARVVPLYWATTTLYLAMACVGAGAINREVSELLRPGFVVASYLFWPMARSNGALHPLYSVGWTLNYEMFFYAFFALFLPLKRRAAVMAAVGAMVSLAVASALGPELPAPIEFWTHPIVLHFALGAAVGLLRAEGVTASKGVCCALAAAGLVALSLAPLPGDFERTLWYGVPSAMLVAAATLAPSQAGAGAKGLALRAALALGDASYALYLVHPFTVRAVREWVLRREGLVAPWAAIALSFAASIAVSLAVYQLVERPITARLRAWLEARVSG